MCVHKNTSATVAREVPLKVFSPLCVNDLLARLVVPPQHKCPLGHPPLNDDILRHTNVIKLRQVSTTVLSNKEGWGDGLLPRKSDLTVGCDNYR